MCYKNSAFIFVQKIIVSLFTINISTAYYYNYQKKIKYKYLNMQINHINSFIQNFLFFHSINQSSAPFRTRIFHKGLNFMEMLGWGANHTKFCLFHAPSWAWMNYCKWNISFKFRRLFLNFLSFMVGFFVSNCLIKERIKKESIKIYDTNKPKENKLKKLDCKWK